MLGRRRTEEDLRRGLEDEWSPAGIRLMGLQKGGNIYIYIYIYYIYVSGSGTPPLFNGQGPPSPAVGEVGLVLGGGCDFKDPSELHHLHHLPTEQKSKR
jgi:hypothetical protein